VIKPAIVPLVYVSHIIVLFSLFHIIALKKCSAHAVHSFWAARCFHFFKLLTSQQILLIGSLSDSRPQKVQFRIILTQLTFDNHLF
jgi:hypothetical protein